MTTSPYDNLPTGNEQQNAPTVHADALHYVDVEIPEDQAVAEAPAVKEDTTLTETSAVTETQALTEAPAVTENRPARNQTPEPKAAPMSQPASVSTPPTADSVPAPVQATRATSPMPARYTSQTVKNLWDMREYILPFEESLLVPDTMPDMQKLLFAEGAASIASGKASYGRDDFLAGDVTVYTVYQPVSRDHSPVDAVKSVIPFKTDKCWGDGNTDKTAYLPQVAVRTISAEMVNERKFIVRGELCIKLTEIRTGDAKLLQDVDDDLFVRAQRSIPVTHLDLQRSETTEISQDINIGDHQPAPVKILKESIRILENHRQITSGKLVINASIHTQLLYLGEEDGAKKPACLTNKTDFTQFVPIRDGIDPDRLRIAFQWEDLRVTIEDRDMFLLKGTVTADICGYQNRDLPVVYDAYHRARDIVFDTASQEFTCLREAVAGEISSREVISLADGDAKPDALLCSSGQLSALEARIERDRIIVEGALSVKLLALDGAGIPFIIESSLPLRGALESKSKLIGHDLQLSPSADLKDLWFDVINSRQLEINGAVAIRIHIWNRETCVTLENLAFADSPDPQQRISMAVYVTEQGDTLWDVAKRYKGDAAAIADLNGLDSQLHAPLSPAMKLFIAD